MYQYVTLLLCFSLAICHGSPLEEHAKRSRRSGETCGQPAVPNKARFAADGTPITRIVGGVEATPHSVPWIVSLRTRWEGKHFCGGSLVRVNSKEESDIVVTAAHCVEGVPYTMFDVVLGAHYLSQEEAGEVKLRPAMKGVIMHSDYNKPLRYANDIAIIKLSEPVKFSDTIRPVCLPTADQKVAANTAGVVAGWGYLKQGVKKSSETLQQVVVPTVDAATCDKGYGTRVQQDLMVCAGYPKGGKDSCQNDSGGPLFFQGDNGYVLHGVVSFGDGCAKAGSPGVYTRVSAQAKWIQDRIQELSAVKE